MRLMEAFSWVEQAHVYKFNDPHNYDLYDCDHDDSHDLATGPFKLVMLGPKE